MLIAVIPKNKTEEIRIEMKKVKGRDFLDMRTYASLRDNEEKFPTGKGFLLLPADFQKFKNAILQTETILKKASLLHE